MALRKEVILNRADITEVTCREVLDVETHHDHVIIQDEHGVIRWKENKRVRGLVDSMDFNNLVMLLLSLGYDKNSEIYRKLYRDIGYSLFGYWEIFYWDINNEEASEYQPQRG